VVPRELERINGILERLLELARPVPATFTRIRLAVLVDRAVELFANEIESQQVQVTRDYARDLPPVAADEESLYRAVINLVGNALDAMTDGGRLGLHVGWATSTEGLRPPRSGFVGRQVVLEVTDTGTGIRAEDAERLFNPFFTTKERGTGLGLAVTHKIVEDHGGVIDFHSVAGVGTTFRIVLPLTPPVVGAADVRR
jgi:signal transduction histidine kinase